jgi:2-polyprenyl-3-methyl-5-hydroxy-6-metoxy-1,4-benzoquinol methylase
MLHNGAVKPKELYDAHATRHRPADTLRALPSARDRALSNWVVEQLGQRGRERRIVEVGAADGELSRLVARAVPQAGVLGFDIANRRVERANETAKRAGMHPRLHYTQADLEAGLPTLGDASADAVMAIDVLEHVFDVFAVASELARITRPGGSVYLRVPNIAYAKHRWTLLRGELPVTSSWFGARGSLAAWRDVWGWDGGHMHYFTKTTLTQLLTDVGLVPRQWRDPGSRYEAARCRLPGLLLGNLCVRAERCP